MEPLGKVNSPWDQRHECVVTSARDVLAGVNLRPALAHQDLACTDGLTAVALDTESFRC